METQKHERFSAANQELRGFLVRVEGLANGTATISEGDLRSVSERIANMEPEVGDAQRSETLDEPLQAELAEYVRNLRALQTALERVRCIMLARKLHLESIGRHLAGMQGWVNAYNQTT